MTTDKKCAQPKPMAEQIAYANLLGNGAWAGIIILCVTYGIYVLGILEPSVPFEVVTANWGKGLHDYQMATNSPTGWAWLHMLGTGDYLNFVGLALLALLTIVCYFILIKGYFRRKDYIYFGIAVTEVLVLSLAASGLLGTGGH